MRRFNITVDGNLYEVCVEEITDNEKDGGDASSKELEKQEERAPKKK